MADVGLTETILLGLPAKVLQYTPETDVELTVSGGATPSAQSEAIDVLGAAEISLVVDHTLTGSDSTDLDVEIFTSYDGSNWDTDAYATVKVGAGKQPAPTPITPPNVHSIRWKATNNDGANATKVKPVITIRR